MMSVHSCLERLLRGAARAPGSLPAQVPFRLEAQVLAMWRKEKREEPLLLPLFRGAFVCACAILVISAALTLQSWREIPANEMLIVDSVIRMTLLQK